ncbi:MAG: hypothetical protein JW785_01375 [Acidimicrobiia bacterium]|nr:hypothetical protein [Acidimicrobiia bacterium]
MAKEYIAGVCNIGPAETARRRRVGERGALAALGLLVLLRLIGAPRAWRLLVFFPAAVSAAGYLQAARRFCAAYGWKGVLNFGALGSVEAVEEAEARAEDRKQALAIARQSAAIGLGVALLAVVAGGGRR